MANNIRGDGLMQAHRMLMALAEDDGQRDRELMRFSDPPPPPYSAHQSHNSTRSQSPVGLSDEQQHFDRPLWQILLERDASLPYEQLSAQTAEELDWVNKAHVNGTHRLPIGASFRDVARANVRKRWEEQGIWSKNWTPMAGGIWKHQEPLEETDDETEEPQTFTFGPPPASATKPPKNEEEKGRIRQRRIQEREASRPFHQFIYQVSFRRGRMLEAPEIGEASTADLVEINTRAYLATKEFWVKQKIWDDAWGVLPGMIWMHEKPFDETDALGVALAREDRRRKGLPDRPEAESPRNLIRPSDPAIHNEQGPSTLRTSQQQRPPITEWRHWESTGNQRPFLASPSPEHVTRREGYEDEQIQPAVRTSVAHTRAPRIRGKNPGRPRKHVDGGSARGSSDNPPVPAEPDTTRAASSAAAARPRRSNRLKSLAAGVHEDNKPPATIDLQDGQKTRQKRKTTPRSKPRADKPQGVAKRRGSTQRKAGKARK